MLLPLTEDDVRDLEVIWGGFRAGPDLEFRGRAYILFNEEATNGQATFDRARRTPPQAAGERRAPRQ